MSLDNVSTPLITKDEIAEFQTQNSKLLNYIQILLKSTSDVSDKLNNVKEQNSRLLENINPVTGVVDEVIKQVRDLNDRLINNVKTTITDLLEPLKQLSSDKLLESINPIKRQLDDIIPLMRITNDSISPIKRQIDDVSSILKDLTASVDNLRRQHERILDNLNNNTNSNLPNTTDEVSSILRNIRSDLDNLKRQYDKISNNTNLPIDRIDDLISVLKDLKVDINNLRKQYDKLIDGLDNNSNNFNFKPINELRDAIRQLAQKIDKIAIIPIDTTDTDDNNGITPDHYILLQNKINKQEFRIVKVYRQGKAYNDISDYGNNWTIIYEIYNYMGDDLITEFKNRIRSIIKRKIRDIQNDVCMSREEKDTRIQYINDNPHVRFIDDIIILDDSLTSNYIIHILKKIEKE